IVVSVVLAPVLAPQPPNIIDLSAYRIPPSLAHPLGTDDAGRDVLSRLLFGGQLSLTIGFLVALLSTTIGLVVGAIAGSSRGWVDGLVARATELVLSFPGL